MKVVWTDRAKARLQRIHAYIAQEHPLNAVRVVDRLTLRVAQLAEHPHSGRVVMVYQRHELRELIESAIGSSTRCLLSASTSCLCAIRAVGCHAV